MLKDIKANRVKKLKNLKEANFIPSEMKDENLKILTSLKGLFTNIQDQEILHTSSISLTPWAESQLKGFVKISKKSHSKRKIDHQL